MFLLNASHRLLTGVALVLVVILTAPGWLSFPFLPGGRQDRMITLLQGLIDWARIA
jgi:hypothetical protein